MIHYNILDSSLKEGNQIYKVRFGSDVIPGFFFEREFTVVTAQAQLDEAAKEVAKELQNKETEYKKQEVEEKARIEREKAAMEKILKERQEKADERKETRKSAVKSLKKEDNQE